MKFKMLACFAFASACVFAVEREYIWPEGKMPAVQDHQVARMTYEKEKLTKPYIEWQDAPKDGYKNDTCVILISGGSYACQCDVGLVKHTWPARFAAEGTRTVNFVHRTPRPKGMPYYMSAWIDGQRAVRFVRSQAAKRGFNPEKIVVMGMSAGAHLTAMLATSSQTPAYEPVDELDKTVPCHVNLANTFALAYDPRDAKGDANFPAGMNKPGRMADELAFKFDAKTPPMCMTHGGKDPYSPLTSTFVYRKLRTMKIPAELHLFPDLGHGAHGLERVIEFMRQMGFLGKVGAPTDISKRYSKDNNSMRASYEKCDVWPKDKMPNKQAHQCIPYMEWHMPKELKTKAIQIIWSGGAYCGNSPESFEVVPARHLLNEKGMTVVTVKYRVSRPKGLQKHVTAWQDVQRVVRIVRSEAEKRGLDPNRIGVMGSSAGGHLALMAATSSTVPAYEPIDELDKTVPCNVQWAVCIYPAYALTDGIDGGNRNGGNGDADVLVPEFKMDEKTPPMLYIHGDADVYASMASVKLWEKCREMGVQGEVHTLALRNHCFMRGASEGTGSYTWVDRIWEFLSAKKLNK